MDTGSRIIVTGGVVAGDLTGVTGLSDAMSKHDAVDGHRQSVPERAIKGIAGGAQLIATGFAAAGGLAHVHGNSFNYIGKTHVYRIIGPDGNTVKIGQSMRGVRAADGMSIRGEAQARRLTRQTGEVYRSEVRQTFDNKRDAVRYEGQLIERFRRMFGDTTLPLNKTNR